MSNYTKATNFATKDALTSGNPLKTLSGTELDDEFNAIQTASATKANTASAQLTGVPVAPTAAAATSTTQLATTAFVTTADNLKADLASPTFTGVPAAPTAAADTSTTQLATTAFVTTEAALKADLAGAAFTGAITTTSTIDGRDVAADGVTADAALPKAGGTMTGVIAGFESTGIDDNATSTAITVDSSGTVLVGKTTTALATVGLALGGAGFVGMTRDGYEPLSLNRLTSDGAIANFYKDSTVVGSIGAYGSALVVGSGNANLKYDNGTDSISPVNGNGTNNDNVVDLGSVSARFDDVYATNGTIQTSDRNEKQDILAITTAESNVATACKGLLRSFRWKDSVAEKGDDARIHFGIMAQDLRDAFTAEGLDAGRYAMFTSATWWETQTEVPAVLAEDEVTDEDGNVTTEAVEAKDAYTRTDTFETLAEAPEGATERTRLGVRYPELLSFIVAAL